MENRFNFRVWDKRLSQMCVYSDDNYDDYHLNLKGEILSTEEYDSDGYFIRKLNEPNKILMQSTALKDKNKKEMFESDITSISCTNEKGNIIKSFKVISYSVDSGMFIYKNMEDGSYFANLGEISSDKVEIIGNIYENLEIIGKNEKLIFKDKEQQEIDSIGDIDYQEDKPMPINY